MSRLYNQDTADWGRTITANAAALRYVGSKLGSPLIARDSPTAISGLKFRSARAGGRRRQGSPLGTQGTDYRQKSRRLVALREHNRCL
jgi:hypothetical protein